MAENHSYDEPTISQVIFAMHSFYLAANDVRDWPKSMLNMQVRLMREWPGEPQLLDLLYELADDTPADDIRLG